MGPYRVPKRSIYLGPELDAAVVAYLAEKGIEFNALARSAIAQAIGKPELAEGVKMGRPSAKASVKSAIPKKKPAKPQ